MYQRTGNLLTLEEAVEIFPEVRAELPKVLQELQSEQTRRATQLDTLKKLCLELAQQYWDDQKYSDSIRVEGYYYGSPAHDRFKQLSYTIKAIEGLLSGKKTLLSQQEIDHALTTPLSIILGTKRQFHRCPFHNEKTASLHVTGNKWYCHGCGTGGNTIGFVMKKFNLPFRQAVEAINTYHV
jgi:hypothetical protein